MRTVAVVLLCLAAVSVAAEEDQKQVTYKVGVDAESIAEVAKVLEGYTEGPLALYYQGARTRQLFQGLAAVVACGLGLIGGVICMVFAIRHLRKGREDASRDADAGWGINAGVVLIIICYCLAVGLAEAVPRCVAPDYYAIRDIISSLR